MNPLFIQQLKVGFHSGGEVFKCGGRATPCALRKGDAARPCHVFKFRFCFDVFRPDVALHSFDKRACGGGRVGEYFFEGD